eukprot:CAMPEP_0179099108 /NCGR_PEP_ID=MMETSP0796-20121207/45707_1 /TAXON_ID=73915 /ORGANISM="Pyrodinium bahamense, Strain pbaha01" /LENGTH=806 /DNA_ID=CAMNT_0020796903 /DNA_START=119 /DNA_END=2541 /DNA_ORIENTATION=+
MLERRRTGSLGFGQSQNPVVSAVLTRVCEALRGAENDINLLDREYKNGDCGRNLAHAARLLLAAIPEWPLNNARDFCACLGSLLRSVEGGLSALLSIFFLYASKVLRDEAHWGDHVVGAFVQALAEVESVGEFAVGGWEAMAEAAQRGARATAFMQKAVGRAAHTLPQHRRGVPDTGAMAVAFVLSVMAAPPEGRFVNIPDDLALQEKFSLEDVLGTGSYGTVRSAVDRTTGRTVAIKSSSRHKEFGPRSFEGLDFLERQRMRNWLFTVKLHIVDIFEVLVSPTSVHLVMEHLTGLEVSTWLSQNPTITEKQSARLLRQMLQAACGIHSYDMVHRDLKLENFVFVDNVSDELKLVDVVGTMSFLAADKCSKKTLCGTGPYMSPEALVGECSPAVDIWAIGVIMYLILSRDYPFHADSLRELHEAQQLPLNLDRDPWPHVSEDARAFVKSLLARNATMRPAAPEALQLPWLVAFDDICDSAALLPTKSELPVMPHGMQTLCVNLNPEAPIVRVKTLYLVRHGEALHNIEERRAKCKAEHEAVERGVEACSCEAKESAEKARREVLQDEAYRDAPLSLDGKVMALNTQSEIHQLSTRGFPKPTSILVSPLERTLQTAALIFPGHPNTHVVEALRERRTGLPCDERKSSEDLLMRQTFCHMSFEHLQREDCMTMMLPANASGPEEKNELRRRTHQFLETLRDMEDDVLAVVTHKGFLRELERGPLGRAGASEFGNCEVRVYDVALPADGGELVATCAIAAASTTGTGSAPPARAAAGPAARMLGPRSPAGADRAQQPTRAGPGKFFSYT